MSVKNMRLLDDGTVMIPRPDPVAEAELDKTHIRIRSELRWMPRRIIEIMPDLLRPFELGKCTVIGRGPSIQRLSYRDFPDIDEPIICINTSYEIVSKICPRHNLYVIAVDRPMAQIIKPEEGTTVLVPAEYLNLFANHPRVMSFEEILGHSARATTAIKTLQIILACQVKKVRFYGFDFCVDHEREAVGSGPHHSGSYAHTCRQIAVLLKDANYEFRMPAPHEPLVPSWF